MHSRSLVSERSGFSAYALLAAMALALLLLLAGCSKSNDAAVAQSADAKLAGEIQARLNSDPLLAASQRSSVGVRVQNGVATLSGWVTNDSELTAALNAAQGVDGVKQVVSRLQVGQEFAAMPAAAPAFDSAAEQAEPRYAAPSRASRSRVTMKPTAAQPTVRPAVRYETPQYEPASTPAVSTSGPSPAAGMTPYPASGMSSEPARSEPAMQPVREIQRVSIPAGTEVPVRLIDALSSETTNPDQLWRGTVNGDVYVDDEVVIPSGSEVEGRVVSVNKSTHYAGAAQITLALSKVTFGGKSYTVASDQWTRKGAARGGNTAKKVGTGAAVGAVLGGIFGGGKGAAIGAAAGAGAGAGANTVTKGEKVELDSESLLIFRLASSVTVVPSAARERGYSSVQRNFAPSVTRSTSTDDDSRPVLKRRGN